MKALIYVEEGGAVVGLVIMILAVFIQVVCRYLLFIPTPSSEEIARYAMMYIIMFGALETTRTKRHLRVEILPLLVKSPKTLHIIATILSYFCCAAMAFFALWSWKMVIFSLTFHRLTPSLRVSYALPQAALLMGGIWMAFYFLVQAISDTRMLMRNEIPNQRSLTGRQRVK